MSRTDFSAIVLVGGRSSRMGTPKAMLPFGPQTLLERVVLELKRAFSEILVVAAPVEAEAFKVTIRGARLLRDKSPFEGPLPALERGLRAASHEIAFACSCDLPMLNASVASKLCALMGEHDAILPRVGGRIQTLHAAYRKRCAGALGVLRKNGETRLAAVAQLVNARILAESEVRGLDPELASFFNVNTREDYAQALKLAGLG